MAYITASARQGFAAAFAQAIEQNFSLGEFKVAVNPVGSLPGSATARCETILLTTAATRFRLLAVLRVVDSNALQGHFQRHRQSIGALDSSATGMSDQLLELGNLACGAMNRVLLADFTNVALSSPSTLQCTAERLFADARSEHVAHHVVLSDGQPILHASLCMSAHQEVDFRYEPVHEDVDCGALELL